MYRFTELNPRTSHYEFMGPIGATLLLLFMPLLTLHFAFECDGLNSCSFFQFNYWSLRSLFDYKAALAYLGWVAYLVCLFFLLPGDWVDGTTLRNGKKLQYKINALYTFYTTTGICILVLLVFGHHPFLFIPRHLVGLVGASICFSFIGGAFLYIRTFLYNDSLMALPGNTGNVVYDYFIGRELNPRIFGDLDLKCFSELRPGLIGWALINFSFACQQYENLGGRVTNSMILVNFFELWYVFDATYNESSVLSTMDIVSDGFGWMLVCADYSWVPMNYTLHTRYLAVYPIDLGLPAMLGIVALHLSSYYLFRAANTQKHQFRNHPNSPQVQGLRFLRTKSGSRLLISGYWGVARHFNYLADWLMSVAWSLPCGFNGLCPYFYPIYFAMLLLHRENRDHDKCLAKYGPDWEEYCKLVKWRILPGIY
ncbi:ERG4/ERG24 ergosterol biosynthesis protein [Basidiobolus meristosporus CBS 931.73]|uniref:Delta(14)-sterol reductase n=1 Tax=Basidiobolus meristosporus CBS 931.73 TaxID=1314790 RepID=A0A1Y1WB57_9FUNG|nr:ERG4/ERG24 ergosterol biosynthesis protein [Basidiobolus meristosporus CBS 931.73]|eukprot:ORX70394.1 ERG4/ERG24 ergosterol biosynthesis protein [Basidiobolus meristosporus CBS 931.73]